MKHFLLIKMNQSYGYERGTKVPVEIIGGTKERVKVRFKSGSGNTLIRTLMVNSQTTDLISEQEETDK